MELPLKPLEVVGRAVEVATFIGRLASTASFYIVSEVANSKSRPDDDIISPARISIYSTPDHIVRVKKEASNGRKPASN